MSELKIFYPVSRQNFEEIACKRTSDHPFNDLRLKRRLDQIVRDMEHRASATVSDFSPSHKARIGAYRFLDNPRVELSELIDQMCQIKTGRICGKDLYVPIDSSSCNLSIGMRQRKNWADSLGVIDSHANPGLHLMPSLVLDAQTRYCYGLGDILIHTRPRAKGGAKLNRKLRNQRSKLPLLDKESGAWSIVACNTAAQLQRANRVTFIMDQGGDDYESLAHIRQQTGRDFIVRARHNRLSVNCSNGQTRTFEQHLALGDQQSTRIVSIKSLNHISKTTLKAVRRKSRQAKLHLKYIKLEVCCPSGYSKNGPRLPKAMYLIEVKEDLDTVPNAESPIQWRLLTTWPIECMDDAWKVVQVYQYRWDIEQLFRILKKQGYNVESSQLDHPDRIKKLIVMALKASSKALALVAARDANIDIDIEDQFSETEVQVLEAMAPQYEGSTTKSSNPFKKRTLAWAAWVIARAGGWGGYQSQRPPGPIVMTKGLQKLENICTFLQFQKSNKDVYKP